MFRTLGKDSKSCDTVKSSHKRCQSEPTTQCNSKPIDKKEHKPELQEKQQDRTEFINHRSRDFHDQDSLQMQQQKQQLHQPQQSQDLKYKREDTSRQSIRRFARLFTIDKSTNSWGPGDVSSKREQNNNATSPAFVRPVSMTALRVAPASTTSKSPASSESSRKGTVNQRNSILDQGDNTITNELTAPAKTGPICVGVINNSEQIQNGGPETLFRLTIRDVPVTIGRPSASTGQESAVTRRPNRSCDQSPTARSSKGSVVDAVQQGGHRGDGECPGSCRGRSPSCHPDRTKLRNSGTFDRSVDLSVVAASSNDQSQAEAQVGYPVDTGKDNNIVSKLQSSSNGTTSEMIGDKSADLRLKPQNFYQYLWQKITGAKPQNSAVDEKVGNFQRTRKSMRSLRRKSVNRDETRSSFARKLSKKNMPVNSDSWSHELESTLLSADEQKIVSNHAEAFDRWRSTVEVSGDGLPLQEKSPYRKRTPSRKIFPALPSPPHEVRYTPGPIGEGGENSAKSRRNVAVLRSISSETKCRLDRTASESTRRHGGNVTSWDSSESTSHITMMSSVPVLTALSFEIEFPTERWHTSESANDIVGPSQNSDNICIRTSVSSVSEPVLFVDMPIDIHSSEQLIGSPSSAATPSVGERPVPTYENQQIILAAAAALQAGGYSLSLDAVVNCERGGHRWGLHVTPQNNAAPGTGLSPSFWDRQQATLMLGCKKRSRRDVQALAEVLDESKHPADMNWDVGLSADADIETSTNEHNRPHYVNVPIPQTGPYLPPSLIIDHGGAYSPSNNNSRTKIGARRRLFVTSLMSRDLTVESVIESVWPLLDERPCDVPIGSLGQRRCFSSGSLQTKYIRDDIATSLDRSVASRDDVLTAHDRSRTSQNKSDTHRVAGDRHNVSLTRRSSVNSEIVSGGAIDDPSTCRDVWSSSKLGLVHHPHLIIASSGETTDVGYYNTCVATICRAQSRQARTNINYSLVELPVKERNRVVLGVAGVRGTGVERTPFGRPPQSARSLERYDRFRCNTDQKRITEMATSLRRQSVSIGYVNKTEPIYESIRDIRAVGLSETSASKQRQTPPQNNQHYYFPSTLQEKSCKKQQRQQRQPRPHVVNINDKCKLQSQHSNHIQSPLQFSPQMHMLHQVQHQQQQQQQQKQQQEQQQHTFLQVDYQNLLRDQPQQQQNVLSNTSDNHDTSCNPMDKTYDRIDDVILMPKQDLTYHVCPGLSQDVSSSVLIDRVFGAAKKERGGAGEREKRSEKLANNEQCQSKPIALASVQLLHPQPNRYRNQVVGHVSDSIRDVRRPEARLRSSDIVERDGKHMYTVSDVLHNLKQLSSDLPALQHPLPQGLLPNYLSSLQPTAPETNQRSCKRPLETIPLNQLSQLPPAQQRSLPKLPLLPKKTLNASASLGSPSLSDLPQSSHVSDAVLPRCTTIAGKTISPRETKPAHRVAQTRVTSVSTSGFTEAARKSSVESSVVEVTGTITARSKSSDSRSNNRVSSPGRYFCSVHGSEEMERGKSSRTLEKAVQKAIDKQVTVRSKFFENITSQPDHFGRAQKDSSKSAAPDERHISKSTLSTGPAKLTASYSSAVKINIQEDDRMMTVECSKPAQQLSNPTLVNVIPSLTLISPTSQFTGPLSMRSIAQNEDSCNVKDIASQQQLSNADNQSGHNAVISSSESVRSCAISRSPGGYRLPKYSRHIRQPAYSGSTSSVTVQARNSLLPLACPAEGVALSQNGRTKVPASSSVKHANSSAAEQYRETVDRNTIQAGSVNNNNSNIRRANAMVMKQPVIRNESNNCRPRGGSGDRAARNSHNLLHSTDLDCSLSTGVSDRLCHRPPLSNRRHALKAVNALEFDGDSTLIKERDEKEEEMDDSSFSIVRRLGKRDDETRRLSNRSSLGSGLNETLLDSSASSFCQKSLSNTSWNSTMNNGRNSQVPESLNNSGWQYFDHGCSYLSSTAVSRDDISTVFNQEHNKQAGVAAADTTGQHESGFLHARSLLDVSTTANSSAGHNDQEAKAVATSVSLSSSFATLQPTVSMEKRLLLSSLDATHAHSPMLSRRSLKALCSNQASSNEANITSLHHVSNDVAASRPNSYNDVMTSKSDTYYNTSRRLDDFRLTTASTSPCCWLPTDEIKSYRLTPGTVSAQSQRIFRLVTPQNVPNDCSPDLNATMITSSTKQNNGYKRITADIGDRTRVNLSYGSRHRSNGEPEMTSYVAHRPCASGEARTSRATGLQSPQRVVRDNCGRGKENNSWQMSTGSSKCNRVTLQWTNRSVQEAVTGDGTSPVREIFC